MAQTGARHIRTKQGHGIHHRPGIRGTGDGHKDREHEVSHFQVHGFGKGLDVSKDIVLAPMTLGLQLPEGKLQHPLHLGVVQFVVGEILRLEVEHAGEHE